MFKISNTLLQSYEFQFHTALSRVSLSHVSAKKTKPQYKYANTICLREYLIKENISSIDIFHSSKNVTLSLKTTPICANNYAYKNNLQHPNTYYSCFENVIVRKNSSIIYKDGLAITHDLLDPEHDFIPEEHSATDFTVEHIENHAASIRYLEDNLADFELEDAVLLSECVSINYAHWLIEVLPNDTLHSLQQAYPTHDKIYIKRNSVLRNILNAEEIETYFSERGFQIVEPEKLNFLEQMYLFRNAKVIVGATGAAFGNLVFSQSGCKVYILASEQILHMVSYWANIINAVGNLVQIHYIVGTSVPWEDHEKHHDQHKSFTIDINDLSFIR